MDLNAVKITKRNNVIFMPFLPLFLSTQIRKSAIEWAQPTSAPSHGTLESYRGELTHELAHEASGLAPNFFFWIPIYRSVYSGDQVVRTQCAYSAFFRLDFG